MHLYMPRIVSTSKATIGVMFLDGLSVGYTLEDEYRAEKVASETRIPAGDYQIRPRLKGGMIQKYKARYPWHEGMLHLQDVPGFKYIYIHIGNYETDTAGCILLGTRADIDKMVVGKSTAAYRSLYALAYPAAVAGQLTIRIMDLDR